ncbi:MAG: glycosyltransferase [Cyclobacteriaceae bacterium]|nr:glycosyltransferase [Cyclobacteriaceae bacterium]
MANPLVTIICVCYNQARFVMEALDSVVAQTYQPIELIVIDDGSTDGSAKIIKQWITSHPETVMLLNGANMGYCKTFNKAAALAKGKYLIDLSADDVLLPNRVDVGVRALEAPQAGVTFSDAEHVNEAGIKISLHSDRFPHHTVPSGNIYEELIARFFICSPTMMFSRAMFNELGGYDETLMYEDFDFWIRSSRKYHYVYTPEVLVKKRKVAGSLSDRQFKVRSGQSLTTLCVCEKILDLNKTESERKALDSRLWYEMRLNLRLLNFKIVVKFFRLWRLNRRRNFSNSE